MACSWPGGWKAVPWSVALKLSDVVLAVFVPVVLLFAVFIALIAATLKLLKALTRVPSAAIRCLRAVYDRLTVLRSEPRSPDDATDVSALPELDEDTLKSTLERVLGLRNDARFYDAVFEGGGVKAIGQIGAVKVFEQHKLAPRYLAGTSGGAIIASALAVRDTSQEMEQILKGDLTIYLDSRLFARLPQPTVLRHLLYGISPMLLGILGRYGAAPSHAFLEMMRQQLRMMYMKHCPDGRTLEDDDDVTFDDLRFPQHHAVLDQEKRLRIIATDITRRKALELPKDLADYSRIESGPLSWKSGEPFSVALAVRMSMAIPAIFEPVRAFDKDGVLCHIVDGGVSSNYPIWLFDSPSAPTAPTFGFLLDEKKGTPAKPTKPVKHIAGFLAGVVGTGIGAIDRILSKHDEARSIRIPTCGVGTAEFDLKQEQVRGLLDEGISAAQEHLRVFDWHDHVEEFRAGVAGIPAYEDATVPEASQVRYEPRERA